MFYGDGYNDPIFSCLDESQKKKVRETVYNRLADSLEKVDYDSYAKGLVDRVVRSMEDNIKNYGVADNHMDKFRDVITDAMRDALKKATFSFE